MKIFVRLLISALLLLAGYGASIAANAGDSELASSLPLASKWQQVPASPKFFKQTGEPTIVYTPQGSVELAVTRPVRELSSKQTGLGFPYVAPEGFEFVGLQWRPGQDVWDVDVAEAMVDFQVGNPGKQNGLGVSVLSVALNDEWMDLGTTELGEFGDSGVVWLTVPQGHTLTVQVEFDNVTQTATVLFEKAGDVDAQDFSPLYRLARQELRDNNYTTCPFSERPVGSLEYVCGASQVWRVPYLYGKGWAGEGRVWLVADVYTRASEVDVFDRKSNTVQIVPVELKRWSVTLDGQAPTFELTDGYAPGLDFWKRFVWNTPREPSNTLGINAAYASSAKTYAYEQTLTLER